MRKIYLVIVSAMLLLGTAAVDARQLSFSEALEKVSADHMIAGTRSESLSLLHTQKTGDLNVLYIAGADDGGGYIALSADDCLPPVLGYSATGRFDASSVPPAMVYWMEEYGRQLDYARIKGITYADNRSGAVRGAIEPLCSSRWDQLQPFNAQCPVIDGAAAPTGCTATAVAQVAYVHKWPSDKFQWNMMLDSYSSSFTAAQGDAVAELMRGIGNVSLMNYGKDASGAYPYDALYGMVRYLDYDRGGYMAERDYYPSVSWDTLIYGELSEGRPVVYGGYNYSGGHTFVIDGYNADGYYHLNWGWGGLSDGYFLLSALDPSQQGTGGSTDGYNFFQQALIGLRPAEAGSKYRLMVYQQGDFSTKVRTYPSIAQIEFTFDDDGSEGYMTGSTLEDKTVVMGVRLRSTDGEEEVFYPGEEIIFKSHYGNAEPETLKSYKVKVSSLPKEGVYVATPAYMEDGEVKGVHVRTGYASSLKIILDARGASIGTIPVERKLSATGLAVISPAYSGHKCAVTATVRNDGPEYYGVLYPMLTTASGGYAGYMNGTNVSLVNGAMEEMRFSGKFITDAGTAVAAGEYMVNIYDDKGNALCAQAVPVSILSSSGAKPEITSSYVFAPGVTGAGTYSDPYVADGTIGFDLEVNVSSGFFDDLVWIYARYADDDSYVDDCDAGYKAYEVYAGQTGINTYSLDVSAMETDRTAYIRAYGYTEDWETSAGWFGPRVYIRRVSSGISPVYAGGKVRIYPNPASGPVVIEASESIREVYVHSLDGIMVMNRIHDGDSAHVDMDFSPLFPGHYIVTIVTAAGVSRERLIKR